MPRKGGQRENHHFFNPFHRNNNCALETVQQITKTFLPFLIFSSIFPDTKRRHRIMNVTNRMVKIKTPFLEQLTEIITEPYKLTPTEN